MNIRKLIGNARKPKSLPGGLPKKIREKYKTLIGTQLRTLQKIKELNRTLPPNKVEIPIKRVPEFRRRKSPLLEE